LSEHRLRPDEQQNSGTSSRHGDRERSILEQRLGDSSAQSIYNFSVARVVESVERAKIQPWQHNIDIVGAGSQ
jgi:hypothetical protein